MSETSPSRRTPVRVLRDSVARRIAAGEVVDRPASVVRELVDNALDADAREVVVHVEEGGIGRVRVTDDGTGMTEEDLRLCWLPHATSKIETEDDLYRTRTLGFRGEALASISTVARTEITSMAAGAQTAFKLTIHGGDFVSLEPSRGRPGTVADVADLFYAVPARRKFLKRTQAETAQCRTTFLEKALPFPEVSFKFFTDGTLRQFLPPTDLPGRAAAAFPDDLAGGFLKLIEGSGEGFTLRIAAATPDLVRRDRRLVQIYVNRRRIWEYALSQGVEYTYSSYLPGGLLPACFVFADVDPALADFNIHPAKKEAKLRNLQDIRRRMTEILSSFLREATKTSFVVPGTASEWTERPLFSGPEYGGSRDARTADARPGGGEGDRGSGAAPAFPRNRAYPGTEGGSDLRLGEVPLPSVFAPDGGRAYDFVYRGQAFGLFLIAERGDRLYLVDQHAAHERILFEAFAVEVLPQKLLVPQEFETDETNDAEVARKAEEVLSFGVEIGRAGPYRWALTALPETFRGAEGDVVEAVLSAEAGSLKKEIFARAACRKAVKDGDLLGPGAACEIIDKAFRLENPRCPHGRPIWFEIGRDELFRKVGRIL